MSKFHSLIIITIKKPINSISRWNNNPSNRLSNIHFLIIVTVAIVNKEPDSTLQLSLNQSAGQW